MIAAVKLVGLSPIEPGSTPIMAWALSIPKVTSTFADEASAAVSASSILIAATSAAARNAPNSSRNSSRLL
jgi:hypothetical protein